MSLKIDISYTENREANEVLKLLEPILYRFKIDPDKLDQLRTAPDLPIKGDATPVYKRLYLKPKKMKTTKSGDST